MDQLNPVKIFFFLFMLSGLPVGYASDTVSVKYPRVLLVQLRSEHNRIEAMTKARDYKALEEVKKDALEVRKRMILDFTANFNYCPVYYYIDTNADLIKNKKFKDILLNADGSTVTDPIISSNDHNYIIVYYGFPLSQSRLTSVVTDSSKYVYDPDSPPGKGLVILNDKFQQISYVVQLAYGDLFVENTEGSNYYSSRHYDIEYSPLARLLDHGLKRKRGKHNKIKIMRYHGD